MPTLHLSADGRVLEVTNLPHENALVLPPVTPAAQIANTFDFDSTTNRALADDLVGDLNSYRVTGGMLTKRGAAVAVVAPGAALSVAQNAATLTTRAVGQLGALRAAALQLEAASQQTTALTSAQLTAQLRQTQAALAKVTLATLRTLRLAAGQLDDVD